MQIPIAVEPIASGQFRAHSVPPFTSVAEASTSEEAVAKLRDQLQKEVEAGKQLVVIDLPSDQDNPWRAIAGSLKGNPLLQEWKVAVEEYRRQCDIEAGIDAGERA